VPRRQYDQVTKDLKPIYTAGDADQALEALEAFDQVGAAALAGGQGLAGELGIRDPVPGLPHPTSGA